MKPLLTNQVAIINGGATGMGRATALIFAEEGCSCVIADINEQDGQKTAFEASKKGPKSIFVKCDITDLTQIKACVERTIKEFGEIDILVGSAGGTLPRKTAATGGRPKAGIENTDEAYYDRMMDLNLKGHVFFAKEVAPYLKKQKSGKMVFISSMGVFNPPGPSVEYHGAKAGILGLTINLAFELAPFNINVNAILPGPVKTPFWDPVLSMVPDSERGSTLDRLGQSTPLGRIGQPDDIGYTALFLCSKMSAFITGQMISVGGGIPLDCYHEGSTMLSRLDQPPK
jgi:NAD(P)-dependent dehydrogenase (short-subunit alcohol dehydrogenase family)